MTFKWLPPKPFKQPSWKVWKIIPRDPRVPERGHVIVATNGGRDWFPVWPHPRFDDPIQSLGKCEAYAKNHRDSLPPENREVDA